MRTLRIQLKFLQTSDVILSPTLSKYRTESPDPRVGYNTVQHAGMDERVQGQRQASHDTL